MNATHFYQAKVETPDGIFAAQYTDQGLCSLTFPDGISRTGPAGSGGPANLAGWIARTREALIAALQGRKPKHLPPLDLSRGTDFQRSLWQALSEIPRGETRTYRQIAQAIGRPLASRAVGQACGANPVPVLVPCHRVLAANGQLGGFSAGLDWKRRLLEREGVAVK